MAFSPGWCYQPGLKGPGLYISNGFIFYLSIYTSIIAAATAIFDLASVAPAPPGRTSSSSLPRRRRLLPPPGRAIRPAPSLPAPEPPPSTASRAPGGLVVEPRRLRRRTSSSRDRGAQLGPARGRPARPAGPRHPPRSPAC